MAKKSMIEREKKRFRLKNKFSEKRSNLLKLRKLAENFNIKLEYHRKIQKLPRNSSKVRIRNRCWKTGRPRSIFRNFGVSRHIFREMVHQSFVPGVTKSSW